jgi:hypothetical protein
LILQSPAELANTKTKLARMESRYDTLRGEAGGDEELRDATMESLMRTINQLREDIARYNAKQTAER